MIFIKKLAFWLLGIVAFCFLAGWLVLAAPLFSEFRRSLVEDFLSDQIGQPLMVKTDARVILGLVSHVTVQDVAIPSETIDGLNLAELALLEFDLDLASIISGSRPALDNIRIDGLGVEMRTQRDGVSSWRQPPPSSSRANTKSPEGVDEQNGIIAFLGDKSVYVTSLKLNVENEKTNFEFRFSLDAARIEQSADGGGATLFSRGSVNDQALEVNGFYPSGAPFTTSATLGDIGLTFDGDRLPDASGGGFSADVTLETGEIGDILEFLKLDRSLEGTASLSATFLRQGTTLAVEDLEIIADFPDGPAVTVDGKVSDLFTAADFDLKIIGQFVPEDQPLPRATKLSEVEVVRIDLGLLSEDGDIQIRDALLKTNSFSAGLDEIGPMSIGRIQRTNAGTLAMRDIEVQAGPAQAPYLRAIGHIENLLELKDLAFSGTLNAPANLVMPDFKNDTLQAFGGVAAAFEISDESGQLSLEKLEAYSEDTDLWTMRAKASASSVTSVNDVNFELDLDVPDGGAFLEALGLVPVGIGSVGLFTSVEGEDNSVKTVVSVTAGESGIDTEVRMAIDKAGRPTVRGRIHSAVLNMNDLDKTAEAAVQLASLDKVGASAKEGSDRTVQPLVLDRDEDASQPEDTKPSDDGRRVQPLVLDSAAAPDAEQVAALDLNGRTVQPLVLDEPLTDASPLDLLNPTKIGRDLDLEIAIEIEKIIGQAGVSAIASQLVSKDGKADLGPVEFRYGGGYFRVGAAVDFIDSPQLGRVYGATSGWDFGKILQDVGAGIEAYGKLRADFDLTGNHSSVRNFVDSMSGGVTVSMVNGKIASSLLELAGLGLFPWLFSSELQQGYTDIVCVVAPLRINAGRATSNAMVVETKRVQLVAAGSVDWKNDRIAIRAEPRPVGRPLARTAWPFQVTGRLSSPDFTIGGRSEKPPVRTKRKSDQTQANRTPCKPDAEQTR